MSKPARSHVGKASRPMGTASLARSRRKSWVYPLAAAALFGAIGFWANHAVSMALRDQVRENLQTILNADVTALRVWLGNRAASTEALAREPEFHRQVTALLTLSRRNETTAAMLASSGELARLRRFVAPTLRANNSPAFAIFDERARFVGATDDALIGEFPSAAGTAIVRRVMSGETVVSLPYLSKTTSGMFVSAPVTDAAGKVIAGVAFALDPKDFTKILTVGRMSESGETYAFDREGTMVSYSRFEDHLREVGLLEEGQSSLLNVAVRDPGGNMVNGFRPDKPRKSQPLTRMAGDAVEGNSGADVEGYRDYRGVRVVGAWTWLEEYGFGVTTEVDEAEAFAVLGILRLVFWVLIGLLLAGAVGGFFASSAIFRLRRKVSDAQQLGQYSLLEKIGDGAWGEVYRANHAMLKRPTAVKLLPRDDMDERSIGRFEREAQLTSQLTHPNTIQIYDYGQTPDGQLYYAMEFVEGTDLQALVKEEGPLFSARAVRILKQVAGSLAEAHSIGLVHRDIKPHNIMLCTRGCVAETVKVLDFGLVKQQSAPENAELTRVGQLLGTPLYMSPEAIRSSDKVEARSDVYALGAVGYYLVTGQPPFTGDTLTEIYVQHVNEAPRPPSEISEREIAPGLEAAILKCLEKDPAHRPDALGLIDLLSQG